jgi:uncharacterized RDD family membrane protein YckC
MKDGDIDYSRYTARELHEALAGIRRDLYPRNYANILASLSVLNERMEVAPKAVEVAPVPSIVGAPPLASRGSRLGAATIDTIIMSAIEFPIMYVGGFWQTAIDAAKYHEQIPFVTLLPWIGFGLSVFVLVQGYPLVRDGQTWGKKLVSIKIVDLLGRKPSIPQLCVRYGVAMLVGGIPIFGRLATLVDTCLIFRGDKRCGHDLVAGTRVVHASQ